MKWKELRHNGVAFPPTYEPKGLQINIRGETVLLTPDAEEIAYAWGKKRTTPYVQDPVFQTNFFSDFVKVLHAKYANANYSEINFSPVYQYLSKEELLKLDKELKKRVAAQRKGLRLQLKEKYGWPSDVSDLRQEGDKMKDDNAKKLRRKLSDVREFIEKNLRSPDVKVRKLATVSHLIDNLAMRVGDEKEEDEADTVGASTLRVEHVKFLPQGVEFDFLGKDSVRWQKTLKVDGTDSPIRRNLQEFVSNKKPEDLVFDG